MWDTFLFVVLPYVCLAIFVVGHVWRYRNDQFGWTTRTSQVLEKRWLAWGSPCSTSGRCSRSSATPRGS
ncbi:respiratory nitrate reductase subunit gamma [Oerskovia sp. M15]